MKMVHKNKESLVEWGRKYYLVNKERIRKHGKEYYHANKERILAQMRKQSLDEAWKQKKSKYYEDNKIRLTANARKKYLKEYPTKIYNATELVRSLCCMAKVKKSGRGNWFCKRCLDIIKTAMLVTYILQKSDNTKGLVIQVVIL